MVKATAMAQTETTRLTTDTKVPVHPKRFALRVARLLET
jgi:hypothetical protein